MESLFVWLGAALVVCKLIFPNKMIRRRYDMFLVKEFSLRIVFEFRVEPYSRKKGLNSPSSQ